MRSTIEKILEEVKVDQDQMKEFQMRRCRSTDDHEHADIETGSSSSIESSDDETNKTQEKRDYDFYHL